jgi:hypothetical protein
MRIYRAGMVFGLPPLGIVCVEFFGYAILRGGVKEPLAVEPTQDAAIEKARKLDPDAAIHVERVRNVEGDGRDKWRRI